MGLGWVASVWVRCKLGRGRWRVVPIQARVVVAGQRLGVGRGGGVRSGECGTQCGACPMSAHGEGRARWDMGWHGRGTSGLGEKLTAPGSLGSESRAARPQTATSGQGPRERTAMSTEQGWASYRLGWLEAGAEVRRHETHEAAASTEMLRRVPLVGAGR